MPGSYVFLKRTSMLCASLYGFLFSISLMSSSFTLLGEGFAHNLISSTANPLAGLFIGLFVTSIVQSSSCTTSIVVSLVASRSLPLSNAIPVIFGSNIGTSVTNVIVSLGHANRRGEFERAFSGAIVHDLFNIIGVLMIFPLELNFRMIERISLWATGLISHSGGMQLASPINHIIDPLKGPLIGFFSGYHYGGYVLALFSAILLFASLRAMTRLMRQVMMGPIEGLIHRFIFKSPHISFFVGLITTAIVQSSSITTSLLVPLIGAGILTVEAAFPFMLGANVGTTVTALLASLATVGDESFSGITIALAHMFFNIFGIILIYPLRRIPIGLARRISGILTAKNRNAIVFIIAAFYLIPLAVIIASNAID